MKIDNEAVNSKINQQDFVEASVNGCVVKTAQENIPASEIRQRAFTELLRQEAQIQGLLRQDDQPITKGIISEAASIAIELLLEANIKTIEPSEEACQRHFQANLAQYNQTEKVHAKHILFAVTDGVDVNALRKHAEHTLLNLRCHDQDQQTAIDKFTKAAKEFSNCPSSEQGGDLGWLSKQDCVAEFTQEIFGKTDIGILPKLVHSRFGFHIVEVLERDSGSIPSFEEVKPAVVNRLTQQSYLTALRQYTNKLAQNSQIIGIDLQMPEN